MTDLRITARLAYDVAAPTSFAFSIVADRTPFQVVTSERIDVSNDAPWTLVPYGEGTHQLLRISVDPGPLELSYEATVSIDGHVGRPAELTEVPFDQVPANVLPYLNASRYCESDRLGDFAQRHFGHVAPGVDRVQAVNNWVTDNLLYVAGSTDGSSSAADVLLQRAGVCRDYAHVAITLCRALGVPARYVSGYGLGVEPQDFHGFFEAYIGTEWYLFDPTGMAMSNALVRIGYGRDAADAPFATLVGQAMLTDKHVAVEVIGELGAEPTATSTA